MKYIEHLSVAEMAEVLVHDRVWGEGPSYSCRRSA